MISSGYDRLCARAYAFTRAAIAPTTRNSQYLYREALHEALQREGRWLDLGCGHDFLPAWMPRDQRTLDLRRWATAGIDIDASAIRRHTGLRWRVLGNIERLPFGDRTFDLITANMVVEHVGDPAAAFADLGRVLTDEGVLIVHTPNVRGYTTTLTRLIPKRLVRPLAGLLLGRDQADVYPTFYRANSIGALKTAAAAANLRLASFQYVDSSPQFIRLPPLMALELWLVRVLQRPVLSKYRACIIATFERSDRQPGSEHL